MRAELLKIQKCPEYARRCRQKNLRYEALGKVVKESVSAASTAVSIEDMAEKLLKNSYSADMFDFGWQCEQAISADAKKISRLFNFILDDGAKIVGVNKECMCPSDRFSIVEATADMIIQRSDGGYAAVIINLGTGKRSTRGKSAATQTMYNPSVVTVKYYLEKQYPGIVIWDTYLNNAGDTEGCIVPEIDASDRAEGQFKVVSYKEFYNGGVFDYERFRTEVSEKAFTDCGEEDCSLCEVADICKNRISQLAPDYETVIEQEPVGCYKLPTFTDEQKAIIEKTDGAFLVVAGPGSGKTACLVARICYLVSDVGVPPEFIMAVTFTNKAADEIRHRIADVLGVEINVFTLNGLGYSILRSNSKRLNLEPSKLLTKELQDAIITALISDRGSGLEGFKFGLRDGKTGYLATLENRIREYKKEGVSYLEKKGLGEEFVEFVKLYDATVEAGGYITYDEQISKCVELLSSDEELLKAYRSTCKYMCVDEFQDINSDQWKFINLLAGETGNLMCIGDDDQAIFGFQGGDVRFMLNFRESYPEAETFFLTRNFRSSGNVVSLAAKNLGNDLARIDKNIIAVKGPGADIGVYEGSIPEQVRNLVNELLTSGVNAEDVAVIASKNATLDLIAGGSKLPFAVEGELLVKSAFFTFLRTSLVLIRNSGDKIAMYQYFSLFGLPCPREEEFREKLFASDSSGACVRLFDEESAYKCLVFVKESIDSSLADFFYKTAAISGYLNQKVYSQMIDEMESRGIRTVDTFADISQRMYKSGDTTSLERDYPGRVVCTTVHKAKGREWKYVIVADDFGKRSDATQRAIYVALTRAIDVLYIVKESGGKSSLISA